MRPKYELVFNSISPSPCLYRSQFSYNVRFAYLWWIINAPNCFAWQIDSLRSNVCSFSLQTDACNSFAQCNSIHLKHLIWLLTCLLFVFFSLHLFGSFCDDLHFIFGISGKWRIDVGIHLLSPQICCESDKRKKVSENAVLSLSFFFFVLSLALIHVYLFRFSFACVDIFCKEQFVCALHFPFHISVVLVFMPFFHSLLARHSIPCVVRFSLNFCHSFSLQYILFVTVLLLVFCLYSSSNRVILRVHCATSSKLMCIATLRIQAYTQKCTTIQAASCVSYASAVDLFFFTSPWHIHFSKASSILIFPPFKLCATPCVQNTVQNFDK